MAIWFKEITLEDINRFGKNTMSEFLDIQFIEIGDDFLKATMPVNERTRQPIGILHGGANVALSETVASTAANSVIDMNQFFCVGLEINANHIRSVKEGIVTAIASPLHLGRSTQVWQVKIFNEEEKLTCISRMTASVINRPKE
ncbi:hotdog fold thioesterase [Fluoribacter gormanii]|uniref:1,4-dihydroxy-2-naphthoyl-CoA hydrolase n=1 Tax=Fluoribacter gormanii TaxID=464 RepID=A0A377GJ10_9GAMM|nr:hotdog fold thioesterase [Fluoribacter gormanii]KTD03325.1 esterase [Fluoribacter gormanii]MCW8444086.1 hotdog fold thioesterase [Fluoribacter gormanii]MCW8469268.1 hotdog fold thioesterase [Fluoribacter gormanii]SIQ53567.1 1,4-dihydroxy-2-naphthoyl-CoA hydrolase [Fluoribacter gormanii]STO24352.1 Esterase YdiI [Fluoribacter gormanii]